MNVNVNTTTMTNVARITTGVCKGPYPRLCAQSSLGNALARITTGMRKGPHPRLCAQFPLCAGQNHEDNLARITTGVCKGPYPRLCAQSFARKQCCTDNDTDMQRAISETLCSVSLAISSAFHQQERCCTDNDKDMQRATSETLCSAFLLAYDRPCSS